MIRPLIFGVTAVLALSACQPPSVLTRGGAPSGDLSSELVRRHAPGPPPATADGFCWASDVTPAVIETVTEHVMVQPAELDSQGHIRAPASFRTVTRQDIVQDREEVWFRIPCSSNMTVEFVATLQRALKARGIYRAPLTGLLDAHTRDAIRRYQEPRGLNSPVLSLAAARDLGLVAYMPDEN